MGMKMRDVLTGMTMTAEEMFSEHADVPAELPVVFVHNNVIFSIDKMTIVKGKYLKLEGGS